MSHLLNGNFSKSSQPMSLAVVWIKSSSIVEGILALAVQLGSYSDTFSANTFDEMVACNNYFCSLCSLFSFEKLQNLIMQCIWSPCSKTILKASCLHWIVGHHIIYKINMENVNHCCKEAVMSTGLLIFSFKCFFLLLAGCRLIIGSFFQTKSPMRFCVLFSL